MNLQHFSINKKNNLNSVKFIENYLNNFHGRIDRFNHIYFIKLIFMLKKGVLVYH